MTEYATYLQSGDALTSTGTVDARSPEAAIRQVAKQKHDGEGLIEGTFIAVLKKAVTTVNVKLTPSVEVTIESDREVVPRKQQQDEAQNSQAPAEPVPA